ncbi:MAG: NAD(P)/FAD-dependent oxidoreductase [Clostridia bacterium]
MHRRIVIAGGGIAGLNAAKAAREQDTDCSIIILDEGDKNTYIRTRLPDYISGEASYQELFPYDDAWYGRNKLTTYKNTKVAGIDVSKKTISTTMGLLEFDCLVIALGSSGNIPPIPGVDLENCFSVRTLADADKIKRLSDKGKACTILGGGLLGLEMAWAIKQLGCEINIIEHNSRLLSRQIDEQGAALLHKAISDKGIKLYLNADVQEVAGSGKLEYVKLKDGTEIQSDFVILSTGVKANTQPFITSGINIGRSIVVDGHMQTNVEGIYAAGDIAEYNGKNFSIWPIAVAQGKVAGNNAAGGAMEYAEINPYTSLKIKGITMFSIGDVFSADSMVANELDLEANRYIKLFIKDDIISGAIVFGDSSLPTKIRKAVEQKTKLPAVIDNINITELIENL